MRRHLLPTFILALVGAVALSLPVEAPLDIVTRLRGGYPDRLSPVDSEKLLREIAAELNAGGAPDVYGVLADRGGNHCGPIECDIICRTDGQHWDVFIGGTDTTQDGPRGCTPHSACEDGKADGQYWGLATAAWQPNGALADPSRCRVIPGGGGGPPPDPPKPCPTCPACPACPPAPGCPTCPPDQRAEVEALQRQIATIKAKTTCVPANAILQRLGFGCRIQWPPEP